MPEQRSNMSEQDRQELRIIKGIHAGAHAPLVRDSYVLGSGADCDFILCDANVREQHLEVRNTEHGYVLIALGTPDSGLVPLYLMAKQGLAIGDAVISLDQANAPWQDEVELVAMPTATLEGKEPASEASSDLGADQVLPSPAAPSQDSDSNEGQTPVGLTSPARSARANQVYAFVFAGLGALAIVGKLLELWGSADPPPIAVKTAQELASPGGREATNQGERIVQVLKGLGLGERASVSQQPDASWLVKTTVLSEEESLALAEALNLQGLRPSLQIAMEADVLQSIREELSRHAQPEGGTPLNASYLGAGKFAIHGNLAQDEQKQALLQTLAKEFPMVTRFESRLRSPGDLAKLMVEALRQAGFTDIRHEWRDGRLNLEVRLAENDRPRWETLLARTSQQFGIRFHATLVLLPGNSQPNEAVASIVKEGSLPFRIRSVVSGPVPYVVLDDGSKLMTDGARDGWRLMDIGSDKVEFQGSSARKVAIVR